MDMQQPVADVADLNQYRRDKRRAGNFRWVLVALFFLACACGGYFFSLSSFFQISQIQISGQQLLSEERLRALVGVELGQSIFTFDTEYAELCLAIEPLVGEVKVERRLPGTVVVEITERLPVAVIATGQVFVQIDAEGLVLRRVKALASLELPLISGVYGFPAGILPGSYIEGEQMALALAVLAQLPAEALGLVAEIDISDSQQIRLYTSSGMELRLGGSGGLAEKYIWASNIAAHLQETGEAAATQYIDVSSETPVIMPRK